MANKGKKRPIVLLSILGAVVLLFVWVALSLTSEHPDYAPAARELASALAEAEELFGPLTWEEYWSENGIQPVSTLAAWEKLEAAIPPEISQLFSEPNPSSLPSRRDVFLAHREWFMSLQPHVERLEFRHEIFPGGDDWNYRAYSDSKNLAKACTVGLVGAADAGDVEAVLRIGRTVNTLIAAVQTEPDLMTSLVLIAIRAMLQSAVLRAAVRSRTNDRVLDALETVLDETPPLPNVNDMSAGEARTTGIYLKQLRACTPAEADRLLSDFGIESFEEQEEGLKQWAIHTWNSFTGQEKTVPRRVGPNTVPALEARYWQIQVEAASAFEKAVSGDLGPTKALQDRLDRAVLNKDRSYEFVLITAHLSSIHSILKSRFCDLAVRASIEMMRRYPRQSELPDVLSPDLSFADPFGGEPVLYRKTTHGFLFYTRYENVKDDGCALDPSQVEAEGKIVRGKDSLDWAVVISYVPDPAND